MEVTQLLNPGNGENLTPLQIQHRATMMSELYTYYDARYHSTCCPDGNTQINKQRNARATFLQKYNAMVCAKYVDLCKLYTEETGKKVIVL